MPRIHENEIEQLLALHQKVLEAHLKSDVDILLEDESNEYVIANRGSVTHPAKEARRQRLGAYLQATHFEEYRDEIPPVVTISQDGTLGWLVVQVYARGLQTTADGTAVPLQFVSAWIELYEKQDGRWLRTGNVSNFKG